uniref:Reverse transcriptase domain-containing protein n=1 Tax=Haptolina brevifila TaxID=156173 RepID=A0A7S2JT45_9EUKA|mmetsp:Transcript_957/g.2027  ORF Transcript_957/g.2027 Transcript_957/m.2027 type:complete len:145 (+) Transcript_957:212-646(+)
MLTRYYEKLMSDKGSDRSASEKLFAKLRKRKLSKKNSNSIEGTITETEVLEAIAYLAPRKSPGPDGVPPEFYRRFATPVAPGGGDADCQDRHTELTHALRVVRAHLHADGRAPSSSAEASSGPRLALVAEHCAGFTQTNKLHIC